VPTLEIVEVDPQCQDALALLREAALEARSLYPDLIAPGDPWPTNSPAQPGGTYLVAYRSGVPVACGALRRRSSQIVEVRRMFVSRPARRQGAARAILTELDTRAGQLGYVVLRLETGSRQGPAIALYESAGFARIPPFDEYANDPTSVCFEKPVGGAGASNA
jgi:GNAT superfamily N-acetyltransferase